MAKNIKTNKKPSMKNAKSAAKPKVNLKSKSSLKKVAKPKITMKNPLPKTVKAIKTNTIVADNIPQDIISFTHDKLQSYLNELFESKFQELDDRFLITEGSAIVQVVIRPWYENDSVIDIFSFVVEGAEITPELTNFLLRKNATLHFGAFGLTFDNTVIFSCSLAGSNLDMNELKAALKTVATIADYYDDQIVAIAGGKRGIDVNDMAVSQ
jgi:hypothetical protein